MLVRKLSLASRRRGGGRLDQKCHHDRGAAAVEMALVMPLLILMVMGIIDFGRIFNGEIQLSQAAREGARIAALGTPGGFSITDASNRTKAALTNPAMQGTPTFAPSSSGCVPTATTGCINVDVVSINAAGVTSVATPDAVCSDSTNLGQVTVTIRYDKILFGPSTLSQKAIMKCLG